jgi:hypothetical protein
MGRSYKLMGHHLRALVKFVQRGCKLETHGDVPQDIRTELYAEDQQHLNSKREQRDSDSSPSGHSPMIMNTYVPVHPSQALKDGAKRSTYDLTDSSSRPPRLSIPGMRDDTVEAYCE